MALKVLQLSKRENDQGELKFQADESAAPEIRFQTGLKQVSLKCKMIKGRMSKFISQEMILLRRFHLCPTFIWSNGVKKTNQC